MIAVVAALVLIGAGIIAAREMTPAPQRVAGIDKSDCSGSCGDCPLAEDEKCPEAGGCDEAHGEATVIAERCIRCLKCVIAAPDAYVVDDETGLAVIVPGASPENIERGADVCPVDAVALSR